MCICVCLLGGPITGQRERENNNKSTGGREREMEKEKITHVLAIKDGFGLEEESHTADCCCYDLFPSLSAFYRRVSLFHICEEQRKY